MTLIVLSPIQNPKQIGPELHTTLNQVATKFGINVVCDAFISDIFVPDYDTSSADNAILDIAKKSGRVFENLNGVYILRKKSANRLRKSEFLNQTTEITPINNIIVTAQRLNRLQILGRIPGKTMTNQEAQALYRQGEEVAV